MIGLGLPEERHFMPISAMHPLWADSSHGFCPFTEDQAVEIMSDVGERELGLGAGHAYGAGEEAEPVFLMGEDVLDRSPDRRFAGIGTNICAGIGRLGELRRSMLSTGTEVSPDVGFQNSLPGRFWFR